MSPDAEAERERSVESLVRLAREGDGEASAELVRRFEPLLRLKVRTWLRQNPELRRLLDSMDVCQSVLSRLLLRVAQGHYDLDRPEQVRGLLELMARNRVSHHRRRLHARKRDVGRDRPIDPLQVEAGSRVSPARLAEDRELVALIRGRLSPDEFRLVELRAEGRTWPEVAAELGGTAESRRKQWARAVGRLATDLNGDDASGDGADDA